MKHCLLIISCILISTIVTAQRYTLDSIPLTWNDFTIVDGDPSSFRRTIAIINTAITYEFEMKQSGQENFLVVRSEVKQKRSGSWVWKRYLDNATPAENKELLDHEKGHWLIALIHHKLFCEQIKEHTFGRKPKREIRAIYRSMLKDRSKENELYDQESNHMLNRELQEQWISQLMAKFNTLYADDLGISYTSEIEIKLN